MTPLRHNKTLGILHLAYAGVTVLLIVVAAIFLFVVLGILATTESSSGDSSPILLTLILTVVMGLNLFLVSPSFLAGYGFLKRKSWAKNVGLIAAIVAGLNFPLGSALCVYTLWFLFGDNGRSLYDKAAYALPPSPPLWTTADSREQERAYVPPSTPPDWR
jgi:hypothetical protein